MSDNLKEVELKRGSLEKIELKNSTALSQQVDNLVKERDSLQSVLNEIKKKTNDLTDSWDSMTSQSVFNNFKEMYVEFEKFIDNFNKDIVFLKNTIGKFGDYEERANKEIDDNIAS